MSHTKINLMHVTLNLGVAGLERVVTELSLKMNRDIFNVEVCCFSALGHFADVLENNGIKVTLLQRNPNHFDATHPWHVGSFLKKKKVHLLHAHTGTFFTGTVAAKLAGVPAIFYTEHGRFIVDPLVRLVEDRISVQFTDKVIAVSPELRDRLIKQVRFPARKVIVVANGVNMELFCPRPKPKGVMSDLKIPDNCRIIGAVGRFEPVKDHLTMIRAFEIVSGRLPDLALLLVGDGSLRSTLYEYVNSHNLRNRVFFAGIRNDIPAMLNLMDVFVLSSLSEGTSVSLLEAMASGVVPVVTDVGGNPSIVDNMINGLVVKPQNPMQMADAIYGLLVDDQIRSLYCQNAVEKIRRNYSLDRTVEIYTDLYLGVLKNKRKFKKSLSDLRLETPPIGAEHDDNTEKNPEPR